MHLATVAPRITKVRWKEKAAALSDLPDPDIWSRLQERWRAESAPGVFLKNVHTSLRQNRQWVPLFHSKPGIGQQRHPEVQ